VRSSTARFPNEASVGLDVAFNSFCGGSCSFAGSESFRLEVSDMATGCELVEFVVEQWQTVDSTLGVADIEFGRLEPWSAVISQGTPRATAPSVQSQSGC
jgi:hypothetical protein